MTAAESAGPSFRRPLFNRTLLTGGIAARRRQPAVNTTCAPLLRHSAGAVNRLARATVGRHPQPNIAIASRRRAADIRDAAATLSV